MIERILIAPQQILPAEALSLTTDALPKFEGLQVGIELALQGKSPGLERRMQTFGLPLAFGFQATDLNPVSNESDIAAISKNRYLEAIQWALQCNARYLLLPSLDTAAYHMLGQYRNWFGRTVAFWESLLEHFPENSPLTLVIMNQQDPSPGTIKTLLSRLNHPKLKAGIDIGMGKLFSKTTPMDWIGQLGEHCTYIRMVHHGEKQGDIVLPLEEETMELPALANHLALLNRKITVSLVGNTLHDTVQSTHWLEQYLKLQQGQFESKRFLV